MEIVEGFPRAEDIRALFEEYTAMLIAGDANFRDYLAQQNYAHELEDLGEKYGPPQGRLYLALCNGAPVGCIALRPISADSAELKRLFVRPAYRGRGIARALVTRILQDAAAIGYKRVVLDTLPFLQGALSLYRSLGFREIAPYNQNPMGNSIYMQYEL
jgi:GNAT superfamily N-acetyltransferase